jgi:hypothetical protein
MPEVELLVDPDGDMLSAKRRCARVYRSREAAHDDNLILDMDLGGAIVGVQVLLPGSVKWFEHPDRSSLPEDLRIVVDGWFERARARSR